MIPGQPEHTHPQGCDRHNRPRSPRLTRSVHIQRRRPRNRPASRERRQKRRAQRLGRRHVHRHRRRIRRDTQTGRRQRHPTITPQTAALNPRIEHTPRPDRLIPARPRRGRRLEHSAHINNEMRPALREHTDRTVGADLNDCPVRPHLTRCVPVQRRRQRPRRPRRPHRKKAWPVRVGHRHRQRNRRHPHPNPSATTATAGHRHRDRLTVSQCTPPRPDLRPRPGIHQTTGRHWPEHTRRPHSLNTARHTRHRQHRCDRHHHSNRHHSRRHPPQHTQSATSNPTSNQQSGSQETTSTRRRRRYRAISGRVPAARSNELELTSIPDRFTL